MVWWQYYVVYVFFVQLGFVLVVFVVGDCEFKGVDVLQVLVVVFVMGQVEVFEVYGLVEQQNFFVFVMLLGGVQCCFVNVLGVLEQCCVDGQCCEQKKIGEIQVYNGFCFLVVRCIMISVGCGC